MRKRALGLHSHSLAKKPGPHRCLPPGTTARYTAQITTFARDGNIRQI